MVVSNISPFTQVCLLSMYCTVCEAEMFSDAGMVLVKC